MTSAAERKTSIGEKWKPEPSLNVDAVHVSCEDSKSCESWEKYPQVDVQQTKETWIYLVAHNWITRLDRQTSQANKQCSILHTILGKFAQRTFLFFSLQTTKQKLWQYCSFSSVAIFHCWIPFWPLGLMRTTYWWNNNGMYCKNVQWDDLKRREWNGSRKILFVTLILTIFFIYWKVFVPRKNVWRNAVSRSRWWLPTTRDSCCHETRFLFNIQHNIF